MPQSNIVVTTFTCTQCKQSSFAFPVSSEDSDFVFCISCGKSFGTYVAFQNKRRETSAAAIRDYFREAAAER